MSVVDLDLKHIWHPAMQMKDFEICPPIHVYHGQGSLLQTNRGQLIDCQSSWWCKSLGHQHPRVKEAIENQLSKFEHVISANCTHDLMAKFGQTIESITQLQHVFFASDGSSAVEIAIKLAIQKDQLEREKPRNIIVNLANAYHGETLATLSVSDIDRYKSPFSQFSLPTHTIQEMPYVLNKQHCLDEPCDDLWQTIQPQLKAIENNCLAIIVEPLVQGSGGMRIYSVDFLNKLCQWAKNNNITIIADEIMTGIGRLNRWLAFDYLDVRPDMICLSKGLTSGTIPMSCVAIDHQIYQCFYDDFDSGKAFLHSHTYSGHALGIAAALATIETIRNEDILAQSNVLGESIGKAMQQVSETTGCLKNVRQFGVMAAAELDIPSISRPGFQVFQRALQHGALMRPIGNTLYWLPPLNMPIDLVDQLVDITEKSIHDVVNRSYN